MILVKNYLGAACVFTYGTQSVCAVLAYLCTGSMGRLDKGLTCQPWLLSIFTLSYRVSLNQKVSIPLDLLASHSMIHLSLPQPQNCSYIQAPSAMPSFFCGYQRLQLRSTCLYSKYSYPLSQCLNLFSAMFLEESSTAMNCLSLSVCVSSEVKITHLSWSLCEQPPTMHTTDPSSPTQGKALQSFRHL